MNAMQPRITAAVPPYRTIPKYSTNRSKKRKQTRKFRIALVRHCESCGNVVSGFDIKKKITINPGCTEKGLEQIIETARQIKLNFHVEHEDFFIGCSVLPRAILTATFLAYVLRVKNIRIIDNISELQTPLETRLQTSHNKSNEAQLKELLSYLRAHLTIKYSHDEDLWIKETGDMRKGFENLKKLNNNAVVVSHSMWMKKMAYDILHLDIPIPKHFEGMLLEFSTPLQINPRHDEQSLLLNDETKIKVEKILKFPFAKRNEKEHEENQFAKREGFLPFQLHFIKSSIRNSKTFGKINNVYSSLPSSLTTAQDKIYSMMPTSLDDAKEKTKDLFYKLPSYKMLDVKNSGSSNSKDKIIENAAARKKIMTENEMDWMERIDELKKRFRDVELISENKDKTKSYLNLLLRSICVTQ